jgi:squalene synthase HpnC
MPSNIRESGQKSKMFDLLPVNGYLKLMTIPSASPAREAFAHCEALARSHYENFPVASLALPRRIRPYVAAVYAFARTADDLADEGDRTPEERLALLDEWEGMLHKAYEGDATHPIFIAITATAEETGLPKQLLLDLLHAFRMDVTIKRYRTFEDVLGYCRYSANPVGRLVLHLFGESRAETTGPSDAICTGLQLANFYQDYSVDLARGRMYVPLDDMTRFGYTEVQFPGAAQDSRFRELMAFQVERAREYLRGGSSLLSLVSGRLRLELSMTVRGGLAILDRVAAINYDVRHQRPALHAGHKVQILVGAVLHRPL